MVFKCSRRLENVLFVLHLLEEHDRLKKFCERGSIPGLRNGKNIRACESAIEENFMALNHDEKSAVVALREGDRKMWSPWLRRHLESCPEDADAFCQLLQKTSPWWCAVGRGWGEQLDHYMEQKYQEWKPAREKFDAPTLDRLMIMDNPAWKYLCDIEESRQ